MEIGEEKREVEGENGKKQTRERVKDRKRRSRGERG